MLNDLKFVFRSFRRQPGFALAAVATLAVGIGATTAIFSTVNAAILRPLPFPHPEDLFSLDTPTTDGRPTTGLVSGAELLYLKIPSVAYAAGSSRIDATLQLQDGTVLGAVAYGVTEGFFDLLGLPPMAGRFFTQAEHKQGAAAVVVLSHRFWREVFGGDRGIVGKTIRITNGPPRPAAVVGIAPPDLDMPHGADFWTNFSIGPQSTGHGFAGYARLVPGTDRKRLADEMAGAMANFTKAYGAIGKNRYYAITPLAEFIVGPLRSILIVVLGGAALLLVLACVNVTNLMLARGTMRAREMAVRVALGAGRMRIVRQLLTESFVLASAGALLGFVLAFAGVRILLAYGASELPRLNRVPFDTSVFGFALAALVVTALAVGFAPALRLAGSSLKGLMNESGRSSTGGGTGHRMLKAMIVAEIVVAITLVAGAGWLVRSFENLGAAGMGFVPEGRLVFDVLVPPGRILPPPGSGPVTGAMVSDRVIAWTRELSDRLRAIGGVTDVGTAASFPLGTNRDGVLYLGVQGDTIDPDHPLVTRAHRVSPEFFKAMGIKMIAGRGFTADDRQGTQPVAIVNRAFAQRYLGGKDPLTARFAAGYPNVPSEPLLTIVGVVDDVKYVSIAEAAHPAHYIPQAQAPYFVQSVVINSSLADPLKLVAPVRAAIKAQDPLLPVDPRPVSDIVSAALKPQQLGMTLMLLFAAAALALAAIGIYGVISYASAQRQGEVATRMALGATPANVFWLMMNQGRTLAILGTVIGVPAAYSAGRTSSGLLYEVRASDPIVLASATALVVGITFLSIVIPARRAARIDPSRVLRLD
jgi:predicted permease